MCQNTQDLLNQEIFIVIMTSFSLNCEAKILLVPQYIFDIYI